MSSAAQAALAEAGSALQHSRRIGPSRSAPSLLRGTSIHHISCDVRHQKLEGLYALGAAKRTNEIYARGSGRFLDVPLQLPLLLLSAGRAGVLLGRRLSFRAWLCEGDGGLVHASPWQTLFQSWVDGLSSPVSAPRMREVPSAARTAMLLARSVSTSGPFCRPSPDEASCHRLAFGRESHGSAQRQISGTSLDRVRLNTRVSILFPV
jgi:hypothetical protein